PSPRCAANLPDYFFGQFCLRMVITSQNLFRMCFRAMPITSVFQSILSSMLMVLSTCQIFKISRSIIRFIFSVDVIDLVACWLWSDEGGSDEAMNKATNYMIFHAQANSKVAVM